MGLEKQSGKPIQTYGLSRPTNRGRLPLRGAVLLVDDEGAIREVMARKLEQRHPDLKIVEAANGRDALEKLEEVRDRFHRDPFLIILDLKMPIMDGWEFLEALYEEYEAKGTERRVPVIVLSSTSGDKGISLFGKSIQEGKCRYKPLVGVAKEGCVQPEKYSASGEKGLFEWVEHFLQENPCAE